MKGLGNPGYSGALVPWVAFLIAEAREKEQQVVAPEIVRLEESHLGELQSKRTISPYSSDYQSYLNHLSEKVRIIVHLPLLLVEQAPYWLWVGLTVLELETYRRLEQKLRVEVK